MRRTLRQLHGVYEEMSQKEEPHVEKNDGFRAYSHDNCPDIDRYGKTDGHRPGGHQLQLSGP
jgi:hypothetical protein